MADNKLWWVIHQGLNSTIVHCPVYNECRATTFDPKAELKNIAALLVDEDTVYFSRTSTIEAVNVDGSNWRILRKNIANVVSLKVFNRGRVAKGCFELLDIYN